MKGILTAVLALLGSKVGSLTAAIIFAMSLSGCLRNSVSETTSSTTTSSIDNKRIGTTYTDGNTVGQVLVKENDLWQPRKRVIDWNMATGAYQKNTRPGWTDKQPMFTGAAQDKDGNLGS